MDGDETFEEFERVAMIGAAALSRAAEVLIRSAQDHRVRATAQSAQATEDLQRRAEAQSQAAEQYYKRTIEPGWVRSVEADEVALAWKGSQQWAQIDGERFGGYAAALTDEIRAEYGFDPYETGAGLEAQSRACREQVEARRSGQEENGSTPKGDQVPPAAADVAAGRRTAAADLDYDTVERRAATSAELAAAGVPESARSARAVADHLNGTDPHALASAPARGRGRGRAAAGLKQTRDQERGRGR